MAARSDAPSVRLDIPDYVRDILRCPCCGSALSDAACSLRCESCEVVYQASEHGQLDLRLRTPKQCMLTIQLNESLDGEHVVDLRPLQRNPVPAVDFSDIAIPRHMTRSLLSFFPIPTENVALALDIGCGRGIHRQICEHAGFRYVGADFSNPHAPYLADAHSLPFADESFEFVLSVAVLEHIQYPHVMTREVFRVLKPSGVFLGTVAFLEPYHNRSYYHHTHLGTISTLQSAGFRVTHVAPSDKWTVLKAQAKVLFPGMPRRVAKHLVAPLRVLNGVWCRAATALRLNTRERNEEFIRHTTGAFKFVATKGAR